MHTSAPTGAPTTREPHPRPELIVGVACLCGIVVALSQTMIIPLVPRLPEIVHDNASNASWAITATLLSGAVATPIAGRLGDMFGKRLMLLVSMAFLVIGSVVSALSSGLVGMVAGRALQGLAMGAIALGISVLRDELPADRVGAGVARMSATMGVGGAIGLPLAAFIADQADWHTLFWVTGGLAAVCAIAVAILVPESPVRTPARFDFVGALGLTAALTTLLLAITKGGDWGWGDGLTLGLLAGSLLVFLLWGAWELRRTAPLVDLRISARPQVLFTNIASVAVGFAMYGMSLIPIQILMAPKVAGYGLGLSMTQAGLLMAPSGLLMYLFSSVGARISAARGPRTSLAAGTVVVGLGYVSALFLRSSGWEITLSTAIIGAGVGIAYAAMPALIMGAVPITETAAANGLNSLMRSVGTSLSSAVVSVVLAHEVIDLGPVALPSYHGFTVALLISIAAAVVALAFTALIPTRRPAAPAAEPDGAAELAAV
ncbi:MFS transporter [Nocardioides terrisoli]|uniref:MFS transporter n=1 Tax=Nocardioides terrisoli TaxID=3388267 RepID=UPI00287B5E8E|nr:MFS transporter [Nocardioides marmorisolisilvae]